MSLAIAVWKSPDRYLLAADRRVSRDLGHVPAQRRKIVTIGRWHGAAAGGLPAVQRMERLFREPEADTREAMEAMLLGVFDAVVPLCGPTSPGDYPRTGADWLFVGPAGIVTLETAGCTVWHDGVGVVGCGDRYALGWFDAVGDPWSTARRCLEAAALRFPGIGDGVDVIVTGG